jgi:hypothetical protein
VVVLDANTAANLLALINANTANISSHTSTLASHTSTLASHTSALAGKVDLDSSTAKILPTQKSSYVYDVTASFTLALTDAAKCIRVTSSSAAITVTVPNSSSVAFPVHAEIELVRYGSNAVTIAAASGVNIRSLNSLVAISGLYGSVRLKLVAANTWLLTGNLA